MSLDHLPSEPQAPQLESQPVQPDPNERAQGISTLLIAVVVVAALAIFKPDYARFIAVFGVTLSILVFVHEWGHYQFGRWAGMKINRFGIGFPPWIYSVRRNGIDYSLGALPIGGMVDIAGLGSEEEMVATAKDAVGVGTSNDAPIDPVYRERAERDRVARVKAIPHGQKQFQDAPIGWRFMTLFAGPMMNFIFALFVFITAYSIAGIPTETRQTNRVDSLQPGLPAYLAGVQPGDLVVGVNGQQTKTPKQSANLIEKNGAKPLTLQIERDGVRQNLSMTPLKDTKPDFINGKEVERPAYVVGISFDEIVTKTRRLSVREATAAGVAQSLGVVERILDTLKRIATNQLSKREWRDIGGPVRIAQVSNQVAKKGWQDAAIFMGSLSVNLGLMNLLPIPALDGGRIALLFIGGLYQKLTRRTLDPRKESYVHMFGMVLLLSFMLFITARDVWPMIQKNLR